MPQSQTSSHGAVVDYIPFGPWFDHGHGHNIHLLLMKAQIQCSLGYVLYS